LIPRVSCGIFHRKRKAEYSNNRYYQACIIIISGRRRSGWNFSIGRGRN
jgi:hypothetical protein